MNNTNQQREGWEEKLGVILDETIIDGGFEYNKDDSWIDEEGAKERIVSFIKETLATERERVLGEVEEGANKLIECTCGCNFGDGCLCKEEKRGIEKVLALITSLKTTNDKQL